MTVARSLPFVTRPLPQSLNASSTASSRGAVCLTALGDFAWAERDSIAEIDLNPVMALPRGQGCIIVDALIIPREKTT